MRTKKSQSHNDVLIAVLRQQLQDERSNSWLVQQLLRQWQRTLDRAAYFYTQLATLPRGTRRWLTRKWAMPLAAAALLIAVSGMPVYAATITVDSGARGINPGDGCSLVEAIVNANDDAATYAECDPGTGDDIITLPAAEVMTYTTPYGGADNALPIITETLTIEGNGSTIGRDAGAGEFRLLQVATGDFVLNDATVTGGYLSTSDGGGIYANAGTVTLDHVTLTENLAEDGGGILVDNANLTGNYAYITNNEATEDGGGIYAFNADVALTNSTVNGNVSALGEGGGILFDAHGPVFALDITDSEISGNRALLDGGGISALSYYDNGDFYANVTVTDSVISGNTAHIGGGMALYEIRATIRGSTISGNGTPPEPVDPNWFIPQAGGGLLTYNSSTVVSQTTISDNTAYYGGGALTLNFPFSPFQVAIANSTISGNHAIASDESNPNVYLGIGGGVFSPAGGLVLIQSTVSGNDAEDYGGGVYSGFYLYGGSGGKDGTSGELQNRRTQRAAESGQGSTGKKFRADGALGKFATRMASVDVNLKEAGKQLKKAAQGKTTEAAAYLEPYFPLPPVTDALVNTTISGNTADIGGGISLGVPMFIGNVTVTNNSAATAVGGVAAYAPLYLAQTLISGNSSPDINELAGCECYTVYGDAYNLIGHDTETNAEAVKYFTPGASDFNATSDGDGVSTHIPTALANILETTLNANGGPTHGTTGDPMLTNALVSGSPAIDKIPDRNCDEFPVNNADERSFARNVDGDSNPSDYECDIGAYEFSTTTGVNVAGLKGRIGKAGNVAVKWRTTSESQIAGFNVWRKTGAKDKEGSAAFQKLNDALLQAKHPGDAAGNAYRFKDKGVRPSRTYRYKIEVIYLDGHSQWTNVMAVKTPSK